MNEVNPPKAVDSIVDTIGNTPLVKINIFSELKGNYFAKLESFNPGGSSKDRIGTTIIDQAEKEGLLQPGGTIVEATSGNTGLGLALIAIQRGYKVILIMPDKMSAEKMNLVKAMGCEVIICPTEVKPDDPRSYYSISKQVANDTPGAFYANQYYNDANPLAHYQSTGPEIWQQTDGKITHFLAGLGTGGTISGTAKYLKMKNPKIKIIGIDPLGSILAHYHKYRNTEVEAKGYKIEGVGEDIIPSNVHFDLIDAVITVNDKEAFEWTRKLAKEDGVMVGGSSGMAIAGTHKYFLDKSDVSIYAVILLPDTGERYLGKIFSDPWLRANGFLEPVTSIRELLESKNANLPPMITLENNDSLNQAFTKIQKFRVDQVLIDNGSEKLQLLSKAVIFHALLSDKPLDTEISELSLSETQMIDIDTNLYNLKKILLVDPVIIITENEIPIGLVTLEDLVDNTNFYEKSN